MGNTCGCQHKNWKITVKYAIPTVGFIHMVRATVKLPPVLACIPAKPYVRFIYKLASYPYEAPCDGITAQYP